MSGFFRSFFSNDEVQVQSAQINFADFPSPLSIVPPTKLVAAQIGVSREQLEQIQLDHYQNTSVRSSIIIIPSSLKENTSDQPQPREQRIASELTPSNTPTPIIKPSDTDPSKLSVEAELKLPPSSCEPERLVSPSKTSSSTVVAGAPFLPTQPVLSRSTTSSSHRAMNRVNSTGSHSSNFFDQLSPQQQKKISRQSQFILACYHNYPLEHIRELLSSGEVKPNLPLNQGSTALVYAAERGHYDVVRFLIEECKALPKYIQNSLSLIYCVAQGWEDVVRLLLDAGPSSADVNTINLVDSRSVMMEACLSGNLSMVQLLLEYHEGGTFINFAHLDNDGRSVLFYAVLSGNLAIVHKMVEFTAGIMPVDMQTHNGHSCLRYAASLRCYDIVAFLLSLGCDPNRIDPHTNTKASDIASIMHDQTLQQLFSYGISAMTYYQHNIAKPQSRIIPITEQSEVRPSNTSIKTKSSGIPNNINTNPDNSVSQNLFLIETSSVGSASLSSSCVGISSPVVASGLSRHRTNQAAEEVSREELPLTPLNSDLNSRVIRSPSVGTPHTGSSSLTQSSSATTMHCRRGSNNFSTGISQPNYNTIRIQRPVQLHQPPSSMQFTPISPVPSSSSNLNNLNFTPSATPTSINNSVSTGVPRYLVFNNDNGYSNASIIRINNPALNQQPSVGTIPPLETSCSVGDDFQPSPSHSLQQHSFKDRPAILPPTPLLDRSTSHQLSLETPIVRPSRPQATPLRPTSTATPNPTPHSQSDLINPQPDPVPQERGRKISIHTGGGLTNHSKRDPSNAPLRPRRPTMVAPCPVSDELQASDALVSTPRGRNTTPTDYQPLQDRPALPSRPRSISQTPRALVQQRSVSVTRAAPKPTAQQQQQRLLHHQQQLQLQNNVNSEKLTNLPE